MNATRHMGRQRQRQVNLSAAANPDGRERLAALTVVVMAVATPLSVVFHYVCRYYLHLRYPWSTFLVDPKWRFGDYFLSYRDVLRFRSGATDNVVYSPLMHLLLRVLTALPADVGFALVTFAFVAVLATVCWKWITAAGSLVAVRVQQVAVLVLLSYPLLVVIDRGNLEMVVFIFLAAFFHLYYGRRSRWAWIPLALAIGGKYYWVTLLVIPLSDRQVRQAVYAVAGAVGSGLASAAVLAWDAHRSVGDVLSATLHSLSARSAMFSALNTVQHAHTAWAGLQLLNRLIGYYPLSGVAHLTTGYVLVAGAVFLLVAYEVLSHEMEAWRKVTVLVAATLVLPLESFDYTLVHLYFPLALLLGVCLVPVDYYYFSIIGSYFDVGISTFVYLAALIALVSVPLATGGGERRSLRSLLVWDAWAPGREPKLVPAVAAEESGSGGTGAQAVEAE